jgi:hypothetical protein
VTPALNCDWHTCRAAPKPDRGGAKVWNHWTLYSCLLGRCMASCRREAQRCSFPERRIRGVSTSGASAICRHDQVERSAKSDFGVVTDHRSTTASPGRALQSAKEIELSGTVRNALRARKKPTGSIRAEFLGTHQRLRLSEGRRSFVPSLPTSPRA